MCVLTFSPITQYEPSTIAFLLIQSYADLLKADLEYWGRERERWIEYDREAFEYPNRIGRCAFITCLTRQVIGFGSFQPRSGLEVGVVGHNCILPRFRRHGYGRQQIEEILHRLTEKGIHKAIVSTSEHPFFGPAQRMYSACGFRETRRFAGGPDPRYMLIEYEREM